MLSLKLIQSAIKDLKNITQADYALFDNEGSVLVQTYDKGGLKDVEILSFLESGASSQEIGTNHYFRIEKDDDIYALLVNSRAGDGHIYGRIAVSEITHFMNAGSDRLEKEEFYRDIINERIIPSAISSGAAKLKISLTGTRVVYYIETETEFLSTARELLSNLFTEEKQDYVVSLDNGIVLIKNLSDGCDEQDYSSISDQIISSINTELMIAVKVTYSNPLDRLSSLPEAYRQAKMAMDVLKIFFAERMSAAYSSLGTGRLIYELPEDLCDTFLAEIFGPEMVGLSSDEERLVETFLENSLSIADSCRSLNVPRSTLVYRLDRLKKKTGLDIRIFDDAMTLKLALMVGKFRNS